MDLGAWWRARRWRALLHLIELLPTDSRTSEARLTDPDEAARLVDAHERRRRESDDGDEIERWAPPLHQYDLTAQLLHELLNTVREALGGRTIPPPRTAIAEERHRRKELSALEIVALATPRYAHLLDEALAKGEEHP